MKAQATAALAILSLVALACAPSARAASDTVVISSLVGVGHDVRVVSTTVPRGDIERARAHLSATTGMAATVEARMHALASNDTLRGTQWALDAAAFEKAWSQANGAGVTVAVVDTGVDTAHLDLAGQALPGKDFTGEGYFDGNGHGTHVAGAIAALAGNRTGITGAAPGVRILPIKVLDSNGAGWNADVAAGIVYAADQGAKVINLSLGGEADMLIEQAVNYATSKGSLVVAAGGNSGGTGNAPSYPAAYASALAVAATTSTGAVASYSNHGSYIDIAAPGSSIVSTYKGGGYTTLSGTSMATPYAAALAALLFSANPSWTPAQVASRITASATDIGAAGADEYSGTGLINPVAALCVTNCAMPAPTPAPPTTPGVPATPALPAPATPGTPTAPGSPAVPGLPAMPTPGILPTPGTPALPGTGGKPVTAQPVTLALSPDKEWTTPAKGMRLSIQVNTQAGSLVQGAAISIEGASSRLSAVTGANGKANVTLNPSATTRYTVSVAATGSTGSAVTGYTAWVVPELSVSVRRSKASWSVKPAAGQMVTVLRKAGAGSRIVARTLVPETGQARGSVKLSKGQIYWVEVSPGVGLLPIKSANFRGGQ